MVLGGFIKIVKNHMLKNFYLETKSRRALEIVSSKSLKDNLS